jgi:hypothetical protein
MPRVGDRDPFSVQRIAAELGYLSCIVIGSCLEGNTLINNGLDCITAYNHWCEPLHALGDIFLGLNCIYLVLDKVNSICTAWE